MARYHCALLLLVAADAFEVCPYAVNYGVRTGKITHLPDCASACPGMCHLVDQAISLPHDEDQMKRLDELQCQHHQVFTCAWRESKCASFMFQMEFCPRFRAPASEQAFARKCHQHLPTTHTPREPDTTLTPREPATTHAPREPDTTLAPREPATTHAPREPDTTLAPREPATTHAPREPDTTLAPRKPDKEEPGPIMTLLLALLDLVLRLFSPPKSEIIQLHVHDVQQANILIM